MKRDVREKVSFLTVDRFIKDINEDINATLKTKSISVIENTILKASKKAGLFIVGENSYQLYKKISNRVEAGGCVYIEPSLNVQIYPKELNKGRLVEIKRFEKQIAKKEGGLFFCDEINKDETIHVKSDESLDIKVEAGERIKKNKLEKRLQEMEYELSDATRHVGEYSVRGGIIDVFAVNINNPIRIEFFGNDVETIRVFNPTSQRSIKKVKSVIIENIGRSVNTVETISYKSYIKENKYKVLHTHVEANRYIIRNKINKGPNNIYETESTTNITAGFDKKEKDIKDSGEVNADDVLTEKGIVNEMVNERIGRKNQTINNNKLISDQEKGENSVYSKTPTNKTDTIHSYSWGQFITHEDFGVGVYRGVITKNNCDYIKIEYKNDAVIFLSTLKIHKICPYIGVPRPRLNAVTNKKWARDYESARERVVEIINEMITVNKNREIPRKYSVQNSGYIEQELEKTFPYIETLDQKRAIRDVENDMSTPGLMDRIIIGDVGFGKTEIAIRATVKAVVSGGFVIIVVPTTILADQHFISFQGRLESLGIKVRMLSRFISKKNKDNICAMIEEKKLDVLIGTHAVLNDNIPKKRLSLVIIDEEHKFGVTHKNRLLKLKRGLDVLTLSATPIPRTLQQSLLGVRDVSIIQTAPNNRLPIQTRVLYKDWGHLTKIINKELSRGGQVYFLHNRVETLPVIYERIRSAFPNDSVAMAHGQMPSKKLEQIVLSFFGGDVRVLVCTSIIESGLDVTNANTILINDSHLFGLSQLYQIRGRVGRGIRQAYCYLIIPDISKLTNEAVERLKTLEESAGLGSGYNIALKDLEIRGSGNLFGYEQSGAVDKVGYHLYCKMFDQAAQNQKLGRDSLSSIQINAFFNSSFDKTYIPISEDRIYYYQRLAIVSSDDEFNFLKDEVVDRYGPLSSSANNVFNLTKLRFIYKHSFVSKININEDCILFIIKKEKTNLLVRYFEETVKTLQNKGLEHSFVHKSNEELSVNVRVQKGVEAVALAFECAEYFINKKKNV